MKKKKHPALDGGLQIESEYKLTVKKPDRSATEMGNHSSNLYDSVTIETEAAPYNTLTPGVSQFDKSNKSTSPALLAIGSKTRKIRSSIGPSVVKPTLNSTKIPMNKDIGSLLSKKPLSDLQDNKPKMTQFARQNEVEKMGIMFKDDPFAYFIKHKDGMGHQFIYLKYAKSRNDPYFSPYDLTKTAFHEAGEDYFTMSAKAITHVDEHGNTETCTLDDWTREEMNFSSIRQLRTFRTYLFWKPFRVWRTYVQRQRYKQTVQMVKQIPSLYNVSIAKSSISISSLTQQIDKIMDKNMLALTIHSKYLIKQYRESYEINMKNLEEQYKLFLNSAIKNFSDLYQILIDPKKLEVSEGDFDEIKRKNPNIMTLIFLEQKKEEQRTKVAEKAKDELIFLPKFVRMADYMFIEAIRNGCHKAWILAEENIKSESSAIFSVEISFDDYGNVAFIPDKETLTKVVIDSMDENLKQLEKLPRILFVSEIKKMNLNINEYPTLSEIFKSSPFFDKVKQEISEVFNQSYEDALKNSSSFRDFYPLFKLSNEWNINNYIKTPSGQLYKGSLNINDKDGDFDSFLINYNNEPVVDISEIRIDIRKLIHENERVDSIRGSYVSGAIFLDSYPLKRKLKPIPLQSLNEIEKMLNDLIQLKIEQMNNAFKNYSTNLKVKCTTLEIFVEFCFLIKKVQNFLPLMNSIISFIDDVISLFEESRFKKQKNPLHDSFQLFKDEFQSYLQVKDSNYESYLQELKQLNSKLHHKMEKYYHKSKLIPKNIPEFDYNSFTTRTQTLKSKIEKINDSIQQCVKFQKILDVELPEFDQYEESKYYIKLSENLLVLFKQYEEVIKFVNEIPFNQVDMTIFSSKSNELADQIAKIDLILDGKACSLFREITKSYMEFFPFIDELSILSKGQLQERHWNQLFEECGKKGFYNEKITIKDLISLNIIGNFEKIKKITSISLGEFQLQEEIKEISLHWSEIHIPLAHTQAKTDMTMILAPLDNLLADIDNTTITLHRILESPFVGGIRNEVEKLTVLMDKIIDICKAWQIFQGNWTTVSTLFQQEAISKAIPHQQQRFLIVKRKWGAIVNHVWSNTRLLAVCQYQSLLEDLQDNSRDLEIILKDLVLYVNKKRDLMPRLYFISDHELLTMMSTTSFNIFASIFLKTMMHISRLDSHAKDAAQLASQDSTKELCNFSGLTIFSIVGEDGDILPLADHILCTGPLESWTPSIYSSIEESFKDHLKESYENYQNETFEDFVLATSSYLGLLVLSSVFTNNVDDCFSRLETNQRSFLIYEQQLIEKVGRLINSLNSPVSPSELLKLSNTITLINMYIERVHSFQDKIQSYSFQLKWQSMLKHRYVPTTDSLYCEFHDYQIQHGYEYWGSCPRLIISAEIDPVMLNIGESVSSFGIPLLYGPFKSGKSTLMKYYALMFGHYFYEVQPFPDMSKYLIDQILIGAMESNSWIFFHNIHEMNSEKLEYLFDQLRTLTTEQISKHTEFQFNKSRRIKISQTTRFFLSKTIEGEIPPPLRTYSRPISLRIPSFTKMIEIQLLSTGYKSSKYIAPKLNGFLNSVTTILKLNLSTLAYSINIMKDGYEYLVQMIHANRCPFINYYSESRTAEEFSIAIGCYLNMKYSLDEDELEILIQMIYSYFTLFDEYWMFKSYIQKPNCFIIDRLESLIQSFLYKRIPELNIDLPVDYLVSKVVDLFKLMKNHTTVAICGPPSTGKSTIIQLLFESFNMLCGEKDSSNIPGILPIKEVRCFNGSGSWVDEFGLFEYNKIIESENDFYLNHFHSKINKNENDDDEKGKGIFNENVEDSEFKAKKSKQKFVNGEIMSAMRYLSRYTETHHRVLYLDGPIDLKLSNFLIYATIDPLKFQFTTLDTYKANKTFHIIIETENINNVSPSFMAVCGILPTKTCQFLYTPLHSALELDIMHPSIPFSEAALKYSSLLSESSISSLRSLFCEIVPNVMRKVQLIPNNVDVFACCSQYAKMTAELALSEIVESGCDQLNDNEEFFKISIIFSLFRVFSSIMIQKEIPSFDEFLRRTFSIKLPDEWVGFGLPNSYWNTFPTPSILSMRMWNKRINPHNFNILSLPPIKNGHSITVIVPQYLPNLTTFQLGLRSGQHFLITGEQYSGKESFIQVLMNQYPNIIPIHFYLTTLSTSSDLRHTILKQSQIVISQSVRSSDPIRFALIFHHLDGCKFEVYEFIRMLIISKTLPMLSNYDPKVYGVINLNKFVVIATGTNISSYPLRFVSLFTPLLMQNYIQSTKDYIITKFMENESVSQKFISLACYSLNELDLTLGKMLQIIKVICMLPEHSSTDDFVKMLIVLMIEVQHIAFNDDTEKFSKYENEVLQICQGLDLTNVFEGYQNEKKLLIPKISANNKLDLCTVNFAELKESLSKLSGRKFTNLEVQQYIYVSHSISRIKSHCEICGPTSTGKMSLIKLYSIRNKIKMIDISYINQEMLKSALVEVILTNKQQFIVLRVTKESASILPLLYTLIVRRHYKLIFDDEEIEELYRNLSMSDCPTEIQRRDAGLTILRNIENNCHLIIITESEMNLPNIELIKIKCDSKLHICDEILTEDLVSMKSLFCKIADKVSEILPFSHQNQFYDLINLFAETIKIETQNLTARNDKIQLALSFYDKIYSENNNASTKTDELKPLVKKLKQETANLREELKNKKEMTTEKKNKLNEEMMLKQAQLNQKKQELSEAEIALQLNIPKFEVTKQKIASLTDEDLQPLRIFVAAPTPFVKTLTEICCIVVNRSKEPKILSKEDLNEILVSEEASYETMSEKRVSHLKKIFNNDSAIDQKQLESAPPIVSTLLSYFKEVYQMAHQSNICKSKKEIVDSNRKTLDEFYELMSKELEAVKEIESTFSSLNKELQEKQTQLEEMKVEYKKVKAETRVIDSIIKDSTLLISEWRSASEGYKNLVSSLNGDTIIWASYVIYAGMLPADRRVRLIDCVYDILISENIPVSFTNPIDFIEKKLYSTKMPVDIDITSLPQSLLLDFHHLAISVRVPLVIDLDGLVLNCLKSSNKFVEVSLNSLSFIKVAAEVFQTNKYLAVTDTDRLTPVLLQIINGNKVIQFEDTEVTRNPEFKIFLFTNNTKIYDFDPDLMSRVSVLDTTKSSLEGIKSKIIYSFLDYFDPDLIPRLTQVEKLEISQKEEINLYEKAALDAFSIISQKEQEDGEYSYLKDEETVPAFIRAKDCYITISIQQDTNKVRKEFEMTISLYQMLIDVCFNFWHILTRYIRKVSPSIIRLDDYLNTISSSFVNCSSHALTIEQVQSFKNTLINSLYQLIFPSLSYNEILAFVFLAGFFNKKLDPSEFDVITEHISSEYDGKVLFDKIDLDRIGSASDYLKYSSIDHFFQLIYRFICDEMGRDFLNYLPIFNIDSVLTTSRITILYSEGDKEPTELLCQFVSIRNLKDFFSMISLNKSTIKQTRKLILRGMKEGLWIAINYSKVSIESSLLLNEIPSLLRMTRNVHENFKLILNVRTTQYLSFELMENAKFVRINSFPSIRGTLQEIYYHHSASLKLLDSSAAAKKMTYLSALIFVQIQYRNLLKPCGFNYLLPPSVCSFNQVIHMITKLVEMDEIPILSFKDFLEFVYFSSSVIEGSDRLKLKNIVATFITSNSLDDGFNFLSDKSNELDRWLIPNKTTLQNYIQFISKLPSFEDSDILGMEITPADGLLQWNLSRYFSRTFKKLFECNQSLLSKDSNFGNYHRSTTNFNQSVEKTEEDYESYRQIIIQQIPTKITSFEISSEVSPVLQFWLNEANAMNKFIDEVNDDLIVKKIRIYEGIVPDKWHKYKPVKQMTRFLTYLNGKREFILKYLRKTDEILDEVDISYITNVRAFFNAYLAEYAYRKRINVSSLYYDFSFGEGNEHQSIVINNLTMMNGKIENNCLVQSAKPFNKLPKLFCRISKKSTNLITHNPSKTARSFLCPVYKFVFDPNFNVPQHKIINNEIVDNFVLEIPIQSEIPEKIWVMNGTSIFCNLPAQFVPV